MASPHGGGIHPTAGRSSAQLDLRSRDDVFRFFEAEQPCYVVLSDNLRIQVNVIDAALHTGVDSLLFLGSSCIYPKHAPQPIKEEYLLTGPLEPTNDVYAVAKIAGIFQVAATRGEHGLRWISAMPTNLYGPGDNFSSTDSHVLPALLRRQHEAKITGADVVVNWGTGSPRREFLHVDDLARACLHLLRHYDEPEPINVGTGKDITIRELADLVSRVVGYRGRLEWDHSKPDGTPRKLLDVTRITSLGWRPQITLEAGVSATYAWFRHHLGVRI
jgi:GDP-L-fucose synthase